MLRLVPAYVPALILNLNVYYSKMALVRIALISWRRSLSYRNQSIDLLCESGVWFLYFRDLFIERIKMHFHFQKNYAA